MIAYGEGFVHIMRVSPDVYLQVVGKLRNPKGTLSVQFQYRGCTVRGYIAASHPERCSFSVVKVHSFSSTNQ